MKTVKKCEDCTKAKTGEPLYTYNGETLCAYCIASRMVEANIGVESNGWVGDDDNTHQQDDDNSDCDYYDNFYEEYYYFTPISDCDSICDRIEDDKE